MLRAITDITLIDGTGAEPAPDHAVLWDGPTIAYVGPSAEAPLEGAEVVARGGFALPGLIDSHVHLTFDATLEGIDGVASDPIDEVRERAMENARILLGAGITTARDQGSRDSLAIEVAKAQRSGELRAARILAAGRGLTPTGGHGWMIGVEADGPEAVAAAVRTEIERGADVIKLFPTGGVLGSGSHGYDVVMSADELRSAVEVAHEHGLLIAAHVHGREGIDAVLDAGIDTIEHATDITTEQAQRCAEAGVALVPTLAGIHYVLGERESLPADLLERAQVVFEAQRAGIARAIEAGARVLPGTDAGTPFNPVGNLVQEMILLSDLGQGNLGAITAGTSLAADTLRLEGLGSIAEGATADLVVVSGDPVASLSALWEPPVVIQAGEPLTSG
jgi:imidazolonepropionase-like amidohydrolase